MFCKNFEHHVILYILIIILFVNLHSIYNDKTQFANYKKMSFAFLLMTIIFVILAVIHIKRNKNKSNKIFYAKFFVESDYDSESSYENFVLDNSEDSSDSDNMNDLTTDFEN